MNTRTVTWEDPAALAAAAQNGRSGLAFIRAIASGELPPPPIARLLDTLLPPGTAYTTTDLQVRYLRAMSATTGRVHAEGTVIHAGRRQATAEGRLYVAETGKLLATATTGCLIL